MPHSRILLVEDEALSRETMADALSDAGYEVTATRTGDEAAILFAHGAGFDALLTDIAMPGTIDGVGLAHHAREVLPGLPVLFISGRPEGHVKCQALGGPAAFAAKPLGRAALLDAVRKLLAMDGDGGLYPLLA